MSRIQLALNVSDLDAAVDFYSKLFHAEPAKRHPGYANFAIAEPPLKLVLIENPGAAERLNHLGVEVFSQEEVVHEHARLAGAGLPGRSEEGVSCCYAVQDKVWATDPDGHKWEVYVMLDDGAHHHSSQEACCSREGCCTGASAPADAATPSVCCSPGT